MQNFLITHWDNTFTRVISQMESSNKRYYLFVSTASEFWNLNNGKKKLQKHVNQKFWTFYVFQTFRSNITIVKIHYNDYERHYDDYIN